MLLLWRIYSAKYIRRQNVLRTAENRTNIHFSLSHYLLLKLNSLLLPLLHSLSLSSLFTLSLSSASTLSGSLSPSPSVSFSLSLSPFLFLPSVPRSFLLFFSPFLSLSLSLSIYLSSSASVLLCLYRYIFLSDFLAFSHSRAPFFSFFLSHLILRYEIKLHIRSLRLSSVSFFQTDRLSICVSVILSLNPLL